jgi:uncharacterized OB-fold protein
MSLLEQNPQGPGAWFGDLPVTSRYTFGLAGERFFRALKDDKRIYGTYCPDCDHTYVPAMLYCERCLVSLENWIDVGTTGKVHTFTYLFKNYDGTWRDYPLLVAFIRMGDGGLVHRLGGLALEDVEIGMQVEAVFKPDEDRVGSILDIAYFKPVG